MLMLFVAIVSVLVPRMQSSPESPAGRWIAHLEAARQSTPDGGTRSRSALTVPLEIELKNTDVTASFTAVTKETVLLTGTWKDGRLDLSSEWREIAITNNGRADKARARWVIKGSLKDGVLGGTWDFQMGDSSLPQRWRAERAK